MRRLILAEKFSAARRLAQILSEGTAKKVRADGPNQITFSIRGDDVIVFPLNGHVVELDYPEDARGEVVAESRHSLHGVLAELMAHQESLGRWVRDATFFEKDNGACDARENGQLVRRRARNGWSFLGCSRFPECRRRQCLVALGQRLPWSEREATAEATAIPSPAAS